MALTLSGAAILTAHPRFYWGETGFFDTPAAFELPFDPILKELYIRAQGRNVHFLFAWIAVLNGLAYAAWGLWTGHFRAHFVPERKQLKWASIAALIRRHLRFQNPMEEAGYNLADLVGIQIMTIVGYTWIGMAGKLGAAHVTFWLPTVLLFYIPSGLVVAHFSTEMPLEGGMYQLGETAVRPDGWLSGRDVSVV